MNQNAWEVKLFTYTILKEQPHRLGVKSTVRYSTSCNGIHQWGKFALDREITGGLTPIGFWTLSKHNIREVERSASVKHYPRKMLSDIHPGWGGTIFGIRLLYKNRIIFKHISDCMIPHAISYKSNKGMISGSYEDLWYINAK